MVNQQEYGDFGDTTPVIVQAVCAFFRLMAADAPILDVGAGIWSTPILGALARANQVVVYSLDDDERWLSEVSSAIDPNPYHFAMHAKNGYVDAIQRLGVARYSIAMVSCKEHDTRMACVEELVGVSDLLIVHEDHRSHEVMRAMDSCLEYRSPTTGLTTYVVSRTFDVDCLDIFVPSWGLTDLEQTVSS
jgi:hypothetical protein